MEPQTPTEIRRTTPVKELNTGHATFLSIYAPDRGYLCHLQKPVTEGAPSIVKPIQSLDETTKTGDPYMPALRLIKGITTKLSPDTQDKQSPFIPIFREETSMLLPHLDGKVKSTETALFDVMVDPEAHIEDTDEYMFISEDLLLKNKDHIHSNDDSELADATKTHHVSQHGTNLEIFIHPDCEKLVRPKKRPLEITEHMEPSKVRSAAKQILHTIENMDRAYDQIAGRPDRLTLDHIAALRGVIPDTKLVDDLETAYMREKFMVMGFQQLAALSFQGALTSSIIHDQDIATTFAIAGAIGTEYLGTPSKKDELANQVNKQATLKELLVQALDQGIKAYKLKKSDINGLDDPTRFIHDLASDLSDPDALKSKVASKWGSLVTNSAVLFSNDRMMELYAYAGSGVALNVFGEIYRKKLQEKAQDTPQKKATPIHKRLIQKLFNRSTGRLVQAGVAYSNNMLASLTGLAGQELELGINLITAIGLNESAQVGHTADSIERSTSIQTLEGFIKWAGEQAGELNTDEQYAYYCSQRAAELAHAPIKIIQLPDTDILTGQVARPVEHRPADIQKKRGERTPQQFIGTKYVTEPDDPFSYKSTEDVIDSYPFIDEAIEAKYSVQQDRPDSLPQTAVVYTDLSVGDPERKMYLHNANLVCLPGKIIEIGGKISTPILESFAERRRTMSGTTYIKKDGQETNVHLENNRQDLAYYNCDKSSADVHFFPGKDKEEIMSILTASELFTSEELERFDLEAHTQPFSRSTDRRCALIEALSGDEAVIVLNYQFKDMNDAEIIRAAKFLEAKAKEKIIIIRGTENTGSQKVASDDLIDQKRASVYRKYLAKQGAIESYEIENAILKHSPPIAEEYMYALDHMGIDEVTQWEESKKERFANELVRNTSRIEMIDGKPVRKVEIVRANIYTIGPDSKKYRLKAEYKIEGANEAKRIDRSGDSHSFFRSIKIGTDPLTNFQQRLQQIGWDVDVTTVPVNHVVVQRESRTFQGMDTQYNYADTSIEVPYKEHPIGRHDSGGYMVYSWEEVPSMPEEEKEAFDPNI